jgi:glycopeptide antibiotics resistance protein
VSAALLAIYALFVACVVFSPRPVDHSSRGGLLRLISALHDLGLPQAIGYAEIEFLANVAMFVPLGLLLGLTIGARWWWLALLICVAGSMSIETLQLAFLPGRFATFDDIMANSLGGAAGTIAAGAIYTNRATGR